MSKYKVGDVVIAPISYIDKKTGYYTSQNRRWVIVNIEEDADELGSQNLTVSCTGQIHQIEKHSGIIIKRSSRDGIEMQLDMDTFIYCDNTVSFSDKDIIRKKGFCPKINEILNLMK